MSDIRRANLQGLDFVLPEWPSAIDLAGVAAVDVVFAVPWELQVTGWFVELLTQVHGDNTPPAVSIDYADADGATNATEIAAQILADHTAAGTKYQLQLKAPILVAPGLTVLTRHKTQAADAGVASGTCILQVIVRPTGQA